MKMTKAPDDKYLRLIKRVPLLPIESQEDYTTARALLLELMEKDNSLQKSEIGYAKILASLIQQYANRKLEGVFSHPLSGNEILQSIMDDHNLTQVDVAEIAGVQKQNLNAFLKGRRPLPREAREKLGNRFKVNQDIFTLRAADMGLANDASNLMDG
jgi:antitoxin component HigA of HigAB toxin-antitoxin module